MSLSCHLCGKKNMDTARFCNGCGNSLQEKIAYGEALPLFTILQGRYKIIQLVKKGNSGFIYKASDSKLDKICAVKEFFISSKIEITHSVERFKREASILGNLSHESLPGVIDYFVTNGRYYLVLDFIEGYNLAEILSRDGNPGLPQKEVISWAIQILEILDYLHNRTPPVVYRDIKPHNIMAGIDGHIVLVDFGIARSIEPSGNHINTAIGTDGYAPGEQYFGMAEPRSDLYALGATLHHLLTGISPNRFRFERLRSFNPDLSPELENIIIKALRYKPEERFSSAQEMKEAFEKLFSSNESQRDFTGENMAHEEILHDKTDRRITEKITAKGKIIKKVLTLVIILIICVFIIFLFKRF